MKKRTATKRPPALPPAEQILQLATGYWVSQLLWVIDQPQVVAGARDAGHLNAPRVAPRCTIAEGSFFDSVPEGADGYLLKYIIHDWDDDKSLRILRNIRRAMAGDGRVLLVEHVVADDNKPELGKLLDINMLVLPGGLERTREEFRDLLARADLKLRRVVPTASRVGIVEAVPV